MATYDLIIRGGTVIDGSGGPARQADVAINGDRILVVGDVPADATTEIDATGLLVTPGWVDIHTHYDGQATWDPDVTPSGWHGVTTVVMGNCGVGFAPADPDRREWLIQLMEGVEDIPGTALDEGMTWNWETFPEYLDELARTPRVMDVSALVPHGAVRAYVMGDQAAVRDQASAEQIAEMGTIVADAIRAGAVGFSTTRTILHRAKDGELAAGTIAAADELIGIAEAMAEAGGGVFEIASDMFDAPAEFAWMETVGQMDKVVVTFGCLQDDLRPDHWRTLIELAERGRERGADLVPQVAGRPACVLLNWDGSAHPFLFHRAWKPAADMSPEDRRAYLARPEVRAEFLDETVDAGMFGSFIIHAFHKMYPLGDPPEYEPESATSVEAIAAETGASAFEVAYDLLNSGETLYVPVLGYAERDFGALGEMLSHPSTVLGLGDGGAHCGILCDASLPTYMLTHWTRDRVRGPRMTVEQAVAQQTQRTAELYGFADRGLVAEGFLADLNVIDYDALTIEAPHMVWDLPAGGRRIVQGCSGYRATIKRGRVTRRDDAFTGERPGVLVRRGQP